MIKLYTRNLLLSMSLLDTLPELDKFAHTPLRSQSPVIPCSKHQVGEPFPKQQQSAFPAFLLALTELQQASDQKTYPSATSLLLKPCERSEWQ